MTFANLQMFFSKASVALTFNLEFLVTTATDWEDTI